jgi:hypothetical protein
MPLDDEILLCYLRQCNGVLLIRGMMIRGTCSLDFALLIVFEVE